MEVYKYEPYSPEPTCYNKTTYTKHTHLTNNQLKKCPCLRISKTTIKNIKQLHMFTIYIQCSKSHAGNNRPTRHRAQQGYETLLLWYRKYINKQTENWYYEYKHNKYNTRKSRNWDEGTKLYYTDVKNSDWTKLFPVWPRILQINRRIGNGSSDIIITSRNLHIEHHHTLLEGTTHKQGAYYR
jgi:hypothetical protein